ncbi:MAG: NADH-quinone oxidoreductase subunit L [Anaerolineales bacterium]|nr:MAG: NADH-quinone oxidoreductase subunit L [Anaerolineales bacterium]
MDAFALVPWIVFFPLIGLVINLAVGRRLGERFSAIIGTLAVFSAFVVAVLQFLSLQAHPHGQIVHLADWINIGGLQIPWAFNVDTLSVTMMLVVSGVGTLIHFYAAGYMHYDVRYKEDPGSFTRFFIYLNLFIAAMMILVSGNSYLMLFVGWEGVGLCSFLLIGFWYSRNPDGTKGLLNSQAAKKAFVANRVGDFGFLLAMFLTFWAFGSLSFDQVLPNAATVDPGIIIAITLCMLIGVTGKSAQLPLYVWLPDAMAGPTPVSALIHAATMVTAGVYLVVRSAPLFGAVPEAGNVVAIVGAVTALFAATIAVAQNDIKKVLAYSTISQLGFMVAAVGIGAYVAGMFHLVTHAFFKALLFLSSGSVILALERAHHPLDGHHGEHHDDHHDEHHDDHHAPFDPQDMRNMGGLRKQIPTTYRVYLIGALALAGLPPLAGFFSKDEILTDALHANMLVWGLLTAAAFLTAFYMGRQIWLVFFGEARTKAAKEAVESPATMLIPLGILAALSVFGGLINVPVLHPFTDWLEHTLGHDFAHATVFNFGVAIFSTVLALIAIYVSWRLYGRKPLEAGEVDPLKQRLGFVFKGMENKWWVDELYDAAIIQPYRRLAAFLADVVDWRFWHDWVHDTLIGRGFSALARFLAEPVDMGVIDGISRGLAALARGLSRGLSLLQSGYVRNYALMVFFGVVLMIGYLVFSS